MIKIVTIIGARPQFIKAAAISRAIRNDYSAEINEIIVHTGQHYDYNMSDIFIKELQLPAPVYNLEAGSASHGEQTAAMISGIEKILIQEQPHWCLLYGDTNSTLAGAVAAAKLGLAVAHVEAGLRSFNKTMPEELNRIICDHCSTVLFAPTDTAINNLAREGFNLQANGPFSINHPAVVKSGDVMYDNTLFFKQQAVSHSEIIHTLKLNSKFALCTIHRPINTDNPDRLLNIFSSISEIAIDEHLHFVLPVHPRTDKILKENPVGETIRKKIQNNSFIHLIEPRSFLEMTALEANAEIILTDSGGVQKEAYFLKKPCVILRAETEWTELLHHHAASLADACPDKIREQTLHFLKNPPTKFPDVFGDGNSASQICSWLIQNQKHP